MLMSSLMSTEKKNNWKALELYMFALPFSTFIGFFFFFNQIPVTHTLVAPPKISEKKYKTDYLKIKINKSKVCLMHLVSRFMEFSIPRRKESCEAIRR